MKLFNNLLIASMLTFGLTGCISIDGGSHDHDSDWQERQRDNKRVISQLEINDSRQSVLEQLGAPDFSEAFSKGSNNFRILFYRTRHEHSDGETSKDETTPLVFENNKLIGWGLDALNNAK